MLESFYIAKSKIRQDLLTLYFTNPSKRYYLRELERILNYSAGNIRRELLKFQKDNLFNTKPIGNMLYYSLNTKHPLFKELKNIVFKTVGVEGSLKKILSTFKKINISFIYGSFASKKEKGNSDIDVMIIGNPNISQINQEFAKLERLMKREINPTFYSLKEYKIKKEDKSGFIIDLLKKPKIMLIGKVNDL